MRQGVKRYFEEQREPRAIEQAVLLRIREERLRRFRVLFLLMVLVNITLLALLMKGLFVSEYKPMSAGVEVEIDRKVNFGELDKILKDKRLTLKGPTPEGFYLLEGEGDIEDRLKDVKVIKIKKK